MKKDVGVFVEHVMESIEKIEEYMGGVSKEEFLGDSRTQDAVMRRLEIMGEAVKNIPSEFRDEYPKIPWKQIAGMRDVLIHEYFGVNLVKGMEDHQDRPTGVKTEDFGGIPEAIKII